RPAAASALPTHDATLDEHHDWPDVDLGVAQAISSGHCQGLTVLEGLPVSRFHVVDHIANAALWALALGLLSESGARDADQAERHDGKNQSAHDVSPIAGQSQMSGAARCC